MSALGAGGGSWKRTPEPQGEAMLGWWEGCGEQGCEPELLTSHCRGQLGPEQASLFLQIRFPEEG